MSIKIFRKGLSLLPQVLLFIASFSYILAVQFNSPFIHESDPYYHIKVSELLRTVGILDKFPWTQHSIWRDSYCDKDLLFHFLLIPFTYGQLILGAKTATAFFAAISITLFYQILRSYNVKYPLFYIILLFSCGPILTSRFFILRTYLWSLSLALLGLWSILKSRPILTFIIGVVFSLSYNGAFILLGFAAAHALSILLHTHKVRLKDIVITGSALLIGFVIHPQSSNCIETYNVQNFHVLFGSLTIDKKIPLAGELSPISLQLYIEQFPILLPLSLVLCILYLAYKHLRTIELTTLLICSTTFMVASLAWFRFVEYWAPFSIWFCAIFLNVLYRNHSTKFNKNKLKNKIVAISVILSSVYLTGHLLYYSQKEIVNFFSRKDPYKGVASGQWINQNIAKGENIFVCDWQATAALFLEAPNHNFGFIGDPYYFLKFDSELFWRWHSIVYQPDNNIASSICNDFKSRFILTLPHCYILDEKLKGLPNIKKIYSNRWENIYEINNCSIIR